MAVTGTAADVLQFEFRYIWAIDNFSRHRQETNFKIESPIFTTGANDGPTFRFVIYTSSTNDKNYVSIVLEEVKPSKHNRMGFNISIVGKKKKTLSKIDGPYQKTVVSHGFPKLIEREHLFDEKNGYLLEGKLIIRFEGSITSDADNYIYVRDTESPVTVPDCMALNNIGLRFQDKKFNDVTFAIEGRELRAHKVILAAKSAVFAAMFEDDEMIKRKENRLEIKDIDFEVFEAMLRFIYTGKATIDDKMAARLLTAADKYQLDRLKVMCENKLVTTLSADNAIDNLIGAHVHDAQQLKALAMEFIVMRALEFVEIPQFKSLLQTHPILGVEIFRELAKKPILEIPNSKE